MSRTPYISGRRWKKVVKRQRWRRDQGKAENAGRRPRKNKIKNKNKSV